MNKHTPGPWILGRRVDSKDSMVYRMVNAGSRGLCACSVYGDKARNAPTISADEAEANARLIAAAPDLLAAAKEIVSRTPMFGSGENYDALRAAIDKAEGTGD